MDIISGHENKIIDLYDTISLLKQIFDTASLNLLSWLIDNKIRLFKLFSGKR